MRIRFIQGHKVQQPDGNGPEYKMGEVYEFNGFVAETYGRKYVRRGYAVEEPAEVSPVVEEIKTDDGHAKKLVGLVPITDDLLEPAGAAETQPAAVAPEAVDPPPSTPPAATPEPPKPKGGKRKRW